MCKSHTIIFCFPYAGGTIDFFNDLENECECFEFCKLEYPGHGTRMKEPLCESFKELTDILYPQILEKVRTNPNCKYALLGYSMGSITLFDVLIRIIQEKECKPPCCVFISAHQPEPIVTLQSIPNEALDEWVKNRTIEFGGIDKRLLTNSSFWRVYLPIYRNDYKMIADYRFDDRQFVTDIPMTVFYCEEDTPYYEMVEWKRFFQGKSDFIEYDGGHFFIKKHYRDMAMQIKQIIQSTTGDIE